MAQPTNVNALAARFQSDLDSLATALVKQANLKFSQAHPKLSSPLMRWLDFRHRYVDPYPRPVVFSDKFPKIGLEPKSEAGLRQLVNRFEKGDNVNAYQGRGLILRNDTSGLNTATRTDLLFADWGILHFHLSDESVPAGQFFSKPADDLAFCLVGGNVVAFIDVLPHPDKLGFANVDLFETMARNWPDYLAQFKIAGIAPETVHTTAQVSQMREGALNALSTYAGSAFRGPGAGLTSAGTALHTTLSHDRVRDYVRSLAAAVADPTGQFITETEACGIKNPFFVLGMAGDGLAVIEQTSKKTFVLPRLKIGAEPTWLTALNEEFSPPWAAQMLCGP